MRVKIYTTSWCQWCKKTKEFLKSRNIEFEEKNVEEDHEAAHEMVEKSQQTGVPVTEIDNQIIVGFDKEAFKKALDIRRMVK